ncbi:MAG: peptidase [Pirellulales bacterium]
MRKLNVKRISRRNFMHTSAVGSVAALAAPAIVTAKKSDGPLIVGTGDYRYEVHHAWPQLPDKYTWQTTHNVAVDSAGLLYVIHEGRADQPDHPTIFVFDPDGKYVRSFASEFQGGGHGLEIRNEGGQDFIYVTAYQAVRSFAKLDLMGERVWRKGAPMEAGGYADGEEKIVHEKPMWGRDRFMPTNYAFAPDGGFYLADGYGSYRIHRYDQDANWLSVFGEPGTENGQFQLPHGLWLDDRQAGEPTLVVSDRVNGRLQWFSQDGKHLRTQGGFFLPANNDVLGDLMVVPDLVSRVTLLDQDNRVVAQLGDDHARIQADQKETGGFHIRTDETTWQAGNFIHPHDACFDAEGNIFVAEWVHSGRITKLRRLS